jgi:hypothetical protein
MRDLSNEGEEGLGTYVLCRNKVSHAFCSLGESPR